MLFVFGLIGVYMIQAEKAGRLGSVGFVLTFFGALILTAQVIAATWILPVFALQANAPKTAFEMLNLAGPLAAFSSVVFAAYVPAGLGLILLGIATMRAGVLPRWAGLLLIIGTVLDLAVLIGTPGELIVKAGDIAIDAAKIWIAYALWSNKA
jgi:ethanolamine utilization microcompartment shell protein EutS